MVILGIIILIVVWGVVAAALWAQCTEVSREADEERAQEIAKEILDHAEVKVKQQIIWKGWKR